MNYAFIAWIRVETLSQVASLNFKGEGSLDDFSPPYQLRLGSIVLSLMEYDAEDPCVRLSGSLDYDRDTVGVCEEGIVPREESLSFPRPRRKISRFPVPHPSAPVQQEC
jgi:hypothetical protein